MRIGACAGSLANDLPRSSSSHFYFTHPRISLDLESRHRFIFLFCMVMRSPHMAQMNIPTRQFRCSTVFLIFCSISSLCFHLDFCFDFLSFPNMSHRYDSTPTHHSD